MGSRVRCKRAAIARHPFASLIAMRRSSIPTLPAPAIVSAHSRFDQVAVTRRTVSVGKWHDRIPAESMTDVFLISTGRPRMDVTVTVTKNLGSRILYQGRQRTGRPNWHGYRRHILEGAT